MSEKLFGHVPGLKAEAYDPEGAKKLLAEAGYPDGFNITIHGPNDRYVNDEKIVQAVAQMLTRVGIVVEGRDRADGPVLRRARRSRNSASTWSAGARPPARRRARCARCSRRSTATRASAPSTGAATATSKVDYLIEQALQQVDDENRAVMLQEATELAMQDLGLMPIHFQFTIWATKKGVTYVPRTDEYTLAFQFKPGRSS